MRKILILFESILILLRIFPLISAEFYTALVHLEKLLTTEKQIIDTIEEYLSIEEERLIRLKQLKGHFSQLHSIAIKDVDSFLANPINAYLLVKRLTSDWEKVIRLINDRKGYLIESLEEKATFPSQEDLSGSADAIFRLQDTYLLDTKTLADGLIEILNKLGLKVEEYNSRPNKIHLSMIADDCFELGKRAYLNKDYHRAVLWMEEARNRVEDHSNDTSSKLDILEYLAYFYHKIGNNIQALELTQQLLLLSPGHTTAEKNVEIYLNLIAEDHLRAVNNDNENERSNSNGALVENSDKNKETERDIYEALCRGEKRLSDEIQSNLKCFYLNTIEIPYLRFTRIKVEEAYTKPQIVVFHDFLTESEINFVKYSAQPKLNRAVITNHETGDLETAEYRISESAWLDSRDQIVARIERRISDVTNLDLSTAEELQVVNYGIGGQYEPHYDFARHNEEVSLKNFGTGNRIATWLNYMSDVEAGGATVFPLLGVSIWPKKYSAAFWYNLHKSGDGDLLTVHAACPVLIGSKWVSNKWFHEWGQEFRKPCSTNFKDYNLVQRL